MNELKNYMPLSLLWFSSICGVIPYTNSKDSFCKISVFYSCLLISINLILSILIPYVVLCSTCEGVYVHMKSTLWSYFLKIVHPGVRVVSYIPSYFVALFMLKKYLFDIVNDICISDSILNNKNKTVKKNHFLTLNIYLLLVIIFLLPQKVKIISTVVYEGEMLKIYLYSCAYFGDVSMICTELQFVCFCYCIYYRFKWINENLIYMLKLVNFAQPELYPEHSVNLLKSSFSCDQRTPFCSSIENNSFTIFKTKRNNVWTPFKRRNRLNRRVAPCKIPVLNNISSIPQKNGPFYSESTFESDFRQVTDNLKCSFKNVITDDTKRLDQLGLGVKVLQLRLAHHFLRKAMLDLELLYRIQIMTSVTSLFAMLIFYTYFEFLHFIQHGLSYIAYSRYLTLIHLIQFLVRLYLIFAEPHYTVQEAYIAETIITVIDNRKLDSDVRYELKAFLNDIRSKDLNITPWGFFTLKPDLLTLAIGAVMTYLTVLVQFSNK